MKPFFLTLTLIFALPALSDSFTTVRNGKTYLCEEQVSSPVTCVPNCVVRGNSGDCLSYGSDFCGPDAQCAEKCEVRSSGGDCLSYDSDFCGANAYCEEVCAVRSAGGACLSYHSDTCSTY